MDTSYWTTALNNTPAVTKTTSVVDTNKLGFAMSGVVDLGQSVGLPYSTVDMNSAVSLEFLLNQQRFASGFSFLPYTSTGTAYTTQVTDNSQNVGMANCLSYNTVSKQSSTPAVFCDVPISLALQPSSVSGSSAAHHYKCLTTTACTTAGGVGPFNLSSQPYVSMANMNAVDTPVPAHSGNLSESVNKQTLQLFNLSDLIDYGSGHVTDQVLSSQSREQQLSRNFGDSMIRQNQQPTQIHSNNVRHQLVHTSANNMAQRHVDSGVSQRNVPNYGHERVLGVATPLPSDSKDRSNKTPALKPRSPAMQTHAVTGMQLTVQQQKHQIISNLLTSSTASRPEVLFQPMSTQSLDMRHQPLLLSQANLDKSVTFWPYDGFSLNLGDDRRVFVDNTSLTNSASCGGLAESHDLSGEHVVYEAVSPAGAIGVNDPMGYNFLDSLQLNSLFGSTVDTSVLYAPQSVHSSTVGVSKDGRMQCRASDAKTAPPVRDVLAEAVSQAFSLDKPIIDEADKCPKQKPNLGIVLPMSHGRENIRSAAIAPATSRNSNAGMADLPPGTPSFDCNSSIFAPSDQASFDKLSMPVADGHSSAAGGGGIVLTNITGNVYVNQYTMLPSGAQAVDNALLHSDLNMFSSMGGCLSSYDDASLVDSGTCNEQSSSRSSAPMMSIVLSANEADNELGHLSVDPVTGVSEKAISRSKANSKSNQHRKSSESMFYGTNTSPIVTAKPSNEFESCFLKFLCGHKAETLSSVLNSPIKARPELPKYIPEIRRSRTSINSEPCASADVEIIEPSSSEIIEEDKDDGNGKESDISQEALNSETVILRPVESNLIPEIADRPDGPKLPAKFSHKWKNRTTLSIDPASVPAASSSQPSVKEPEKNVADKKAPSFESATGSHINGKVKNPPNQQWTVAKKPKLSKDSSVGLKLILKVVAPTSARSTVATGSKRS